MTQFGASVNAQHSSRGTNIQAAIGIPIIPNILAIRVAAVRDTNDINGVRNINRGDESHARTRGLRGTIEFRPTEGLDIVLSHTRLRFKGNTYQAGPGRLAVGEGPSISKVTYNLTSLNTSYQIADDIRLSYNFGRINSSVSVFTDLDPLNAFTNYAQMQTVNYGLPGAK